MDVAAGKTDIFGSWFVGSIEEWFAQEKNRWSKNQRLGLKSETPDCLKVDFACLGFCDASEDMNFNFTKKRVDCKTLFAAISKYDIYIVAIHYSAL